MGVYYRVLPMGEYCIIFSMGVYHGPRIPYFNLNVQKSTEFTVFCLRIRKNWKADSAALTNRKLHSRYLI
jgi:hypothetical protein